MLSQSELQVVRGYFPSLNAESGQTTPGPKAVGLILVNAAGELSAPNRVNHQLDGKPR